MNKLKVLDLFSGIGGFSLGLERTGGFETVAFCEILENQTKILNKHWPEIPVYSDVRLLDGDELQKECGPIDVITGGFPCQDLSTAGKQGGIDAERSGLWSEIVRLVSEIRPRYIIVENVSNLLVGPSEQRGQWFGRVLGDLAAVGYDAEWDCISPEAVGFPSNRDRVWICAYPTQNDVAQVVVKRRLSFKFGRVGAAGVSRIGRVLDQGRMGRSPDGLPDETYRFEALGNTVYPQIPEIIGDAILQSLNVQCDHIAADGKLIADVSEKS